MIALVLAAALAAEPRYVLADDVFGSRPDGAWLFFGKPTTKVPARQPQAARCLASESPNELIVDDAKVVHPVQLFCLREGILETELPLTDAYKQMFSRYSPDEAKRLRVQVPWDMRVRVSQALVHLGVWHLSTVPPDGLCERNLVTVGSQGPSRQAVVAAPGFEACSPAALSVRIRQTFRIEDEPTLFDLVVTGRDGRTNHRGKWNGSTFDLVAKGATVR